MATSAINVPSDHVARRLAGFRFLLTILFKEDGELWDVSGLNIKIRVALTNGTLIKTWVKNTDFTMPNSSTIHFDRTTPAAAGLENPVQYSCLVYIDDPAGQQPLMLFDLHVDAAINATNRSAYATGPFAAEAFELNVVSNVPGLSTTVAGVLLTRILVLENLMANLEALTSAAPYDTFEEIEEAATGDFTKVFAQAAGSTAIPFVYVPGFGLLELVTIVAGGGPVTPGGPTVTQRLSLLESLSTIPVENFTELCGLPYAELPRMCEVYVDEEEPDGEGGVYPSGKYGLFPDGRIKFLLTSAEYDRI